VPDAAVVPAAARDLGALAPLAEQARDYLRQAKAENTRRAYRSDWRDFEAWCVKHNLIPLPAAPETVALYVSELAQSKKVATIQRRAASISEAHQAAGQESPTRAAAVRALLSGIRRAKGTAPTVKRPALAEDLRKMIARIPEGPLGLRDRALLLVGFAGAFRRSELVALNCEDLEFTGEGLVVTLRRSKTDPEGQGRKIGIPHGSTDSCPVRALGAWLTAAAIDSGPLFRSINRHGRIGGRLSDKAVALVVKRRVLAAGLDPERYSGHSLRAGLATSAAAAGASERSIMLQTGHRSVAMVRRYIREGELFRDNAAAKTGL
jgi:integrase